MTIESYNRLPIGKYRELCDVDPNLPDLDRQVAFVSVLTDIPTDELYAMPVPEYARLARCTAFLGEEMPEPQGRIMKEYRLGNFVLVPSTDIGRMTTAQYIDFQTYLREPERFEVAILSVILIPKGHKYNEGYDILEVQAAIRDNLSVVDAQELRAFFFGRLRIIMRGFLTYSAIQARRMKDREKRKATMAQIADLRTTLRTSGDGFATWMRFRRPADAAGMRSGIWP